jgi:hypothetical protein
MSSAEISAVIKKRFFSGQSPIGFDPDKYLAQMATAAVAPADLRKITLFDVGPDGHYTCSGFHGRVRNDLPRAVEKIGLKASFYNAQGELIEVRTFWMRDWTGGTEARIFPNAPISFKNPMLVEHLPDGWKCQVDVIEAHYVK